MPVVASIGLVELAQILTAVLGIPTLIVIALTLRTTRTEARAERTMQVFQRYNHRDTIAGWSRVLEVIGVEHEADYVERIRRSELVLTGNHPLLVPELALATRSTYQRLLSAVAAPRPLREGPPTTLSDVIAHANFYEESAMLFNDRRIERALVVRGFGDNIVTAFDQMWWWIVYKRSGCMPITRDRRTRPHETETFRDWEYAVRTVVLLRPELRAASGRGSAFALCLPLTTQAPVDEWKRCQRMSGAVGAMLRRKDGLSQLRTALAADVDPDDAKAVVFKGPPSCTICSPDWRTLMKPQPRRRRLAGAVGGWLATRGDPGKDGRIRALGARLARTDRRVRLHEEHQQIALALERRRRRSTPAQVDTWTAELVELAQQP